MREKMTDTFCKNLGSRAFLGILCVMVMGATVRADNPGAAADAVTAVLERLLVEVESGGELTEVALLAGRARTAGVSGMGGVAAALQAASNNHVTISWNPAQIKELRAHAKQFGAQSALAKVTPLLSSASATANATLTAFPKLAAANATGGAQVPSAQPKPRTAAASSSQLLQRLMDEIAALTVGTADASSKAGALATLASYQRAPTRLTSIHSEDGNVVDPEQVPAKLWELWGLAGKAGSYCNTDDRDTCSTMTRGVFLANLAQGGADRGAMGNISFLGDLLTAYKRTEGDAFVKNGHARNLFQGARNVFAQGYRSAGSEIVCCVENNTPQCGKGAVR